MQRGGDQQAHPAEGSGSGPNAPDERDQACTGRPILRVHWACPLVFTGLVLWCSLGLSFGVHAQCTGLVLWCSCSNSGLGLGFDLGLHPALPSPCWPTLPATHLGSPQLALAPRLSKGLILSILPPRSVRGMGARHVSHPRQGTPVSQHGMYRPQPSRCPMPDASCVSCLSCLSCLRCLRCLRCLGCLSCVRCERCERCVSCV